MRYTKHHLFFSNDYTISDTTLYEFPGGVPAKKYDKQRLSLKKKRTPSNVVSLEEGYTEKLVKNVINKPLFKENGNYHYNQCYNIYKHFLIFNHTDGHLIHFNVIFYSKLCTAITKI